MSTAPNEDGFTMIPNRHLEAVLGGGFSHREQSVVLTIFRKTRGFGKLEDDMSASQIGAVCDIARQHVTSTLNALAARNVITKRQGKFGMIIGIQMDMTKWISAKRMKSLGSPESGLAVGPGAPTGEGADSPESGLVPNQDTSQIGTGDSPESGQVDSPKSGHTKENLPKENHQKKKSCAPQADRDLADEAPAGQKGRAKTGFTGDLVARFERFYAAFPRKRSRGVAEKAFAKLNPDDATVDQMLATMARLQQSGEWSNPQFIPHPASWLNAHGWLDQVQTAYSAEEVEVIHAFNAALGEQLGAVPLDMFVAARAAAIRDFRTFSGKPDFVARFFPWLQANATFPPSVGFDWVISRTGYANLTSGQHSRRAA